VTLASIQEILAVSRIVPFAPSPLVGEGNPNMSTHSNG
jgi:hypothetical protein